MPIFVIHAFFAFQSKDISKTNYRVTAGEALPTLAFWLVSFFFGAVAGCLPLASRAVAERLLQTSYKHLSLLWQMVVHIAVVHIAVVHIAAIDGAAAQTGPSLTLRIA